MRMQFLFAAIPILIILFCMVGLRWGAVQAGVSGYLAAFLIAIFVFGAGSEVLIYAHSKALLLAGDVLFIIWAAFVMYRVVDEAGAIQRIGAALRYLTGDHALQALIIGWVFATFLQGVGGFGVPVAVIAPILVGLGFTPLLAVIIPSIGHGWAVTFGSLGSSFQALMSATGETAESLAPPAALFLAITALPTGLMVAYAAAGWPAVRRHFLTVFLLAGGMGLTQYLVATLGMWAIGAFCGGIAGLLISLLLVTGLRTNRNPEEQQIQLDRQALWIAISGYAVLVALTLGIQLIPVVREYLSRYAVIQLSYPELSTSLGYVTPASASRKLYLLRHAGASLLYSAILAYVIYNRAGLYRAGVGLRILGGTFKRLLPSTLSILAMVAMAVVMENAGMTDHLARALAEETGSMFAFVSPWIGALGAFMTGSNTNSNVIFGLLQLRTAQLLSYSPAIILAAQTVGAGLGSVLAPTKIVVGCSTVELSGKEGEVLRRLLLYPVILILITSLLAAGTLFAGSG